MPPDPELAQKYAGSAFGVPASWRAAWRNPRLGLIALFVLAGLFHLSISLRYPHQRCDDIYYWIGAKSIATGHGYADISHPDAPPLLKYAPLASLSHAPFVSIFGERLWAFRLVNIAFLLGGSVFLYPLLRLRVTHRTALLLMTLTLLHPTAIQMVNLLGNAPLLWGILWLALWLWEVRFPDQRGTGFALAMGATLGVSYYAHRSFLAMGLAAVLYLLWKRRGRELLLLLAIYGAMAFPWMWRSFSYSGHWLSPEYENEITGRVQDTGGGVVEHVVANFRLLPSELGHGLFPWSRPTSGETWAFLRAVGLGWVSGVSAVGMLFLVLFGFVREARAWRFTELYLLVHFAMLLTFFVGFQYFVMFFPWLYLYLLRSVRYAPKGVHWAGWVAIFCVLFGKDIVIYHRVSHGRGQDRDTRWRWVEQAVPAEKAVGYVGLANYGEAQWRYFDSGRQAVGITQAEAEQGKLPYVSLRKEQPMPAGWERMHTEPDISAARLLQSGQFLTPAQRAFLETLTPAQSLWRQSAE